MSSVLHQPALFLYITGRCGCFSYSHVQRCHTTSRIESDDCVLFLKCLCPGLATMEIPHFTQLFFFGYREAERST